MVAQYWGPQLKVTLSTMNPCVVDSLPYLSYSTEKNYNYN